MMKEDKNSMYGMMKKLCQGAVLLLAAMQFNLVYAQEESVCAVVKIEIEQELTLERQAFEAMLKIENALEGKNLENIEVNVNFLNEYQEDVLASSDPNNTDAQFFIRVQSMDNINDVDGAGMLAGGDTATIKWLIIPAPGAAGARERGTLYFVGADFKYTLDGEADTISVAPDSIYVKPMPLLTLDYFIPRDVFGDDPFTQEIEAPEPFALGVRVINNGTGTGNNIKIDSAQPKIVENEQGLLINFELLNSYVGDQEVSNTLLLDFGDIESQQAKVGRWTMQVSLDGKFTEFGASFTHADELGGQLTSLLEATNTHFLMRDVVVDLPGRDPIRDFLSDELLVFESDGATSTVVNQSLNATISYDQVVGLYDRYTLSVPETADLFYVNLLDPKLGEKEIAYVQRSDGKTLNPQNAWISRIKDKDTKESTYYINIFDALGTDTYYVYYQDKTILPQPPVIQFIPLRTTYEGNPIGFIVEASDPDGNAVSITADPLPAGASFVDNGDGTATFQWTPSIGQAGTYAITYQANDGTESSYRTASIVVNSADDTDGDGLSDAWEMLHFGSLDQDADGDFDGDGISNLDEYLNDTNPAVPDGPPAPSIVSPSIDGEVSSLQGVELSVENGEYAGPHTVVYQFELYADAALTERLDYYNSVPTDVDGVTDWMSTIELNDNTTYYWRARAYDGYTASMWSNAYFFANTANDLPTPPTLSAPSDGSDLLNTNAVLEVGNSTDIDNDTLYYEFFVYSDVELTTLASSSGVINEDSDGTTQWSITDELNEFQTYFWQVKVTDEHNESVLSDVFTFVWTLTNTAPPTPVLISPVAPDEVGTFDPVLTASTVADEQGDTLTYVYQLDTVNSFNSVDLQEQEIVVDSAASEQIWMVSGLNENTTYYWRVKAVDDELAESPWSTATSFFVNTLNEAPTTPTINNPGDGAWVGSVNPLLQVNTAMDADNDPITYEFEIYSDAEATQLVVTDVSDTPEYLSVTLSDNTWYYWRARAKDDESLVSEWTAVSSFFVNDNDYDDPPEFTWVFPTENQVLEQNSDLYLEWVDEDPDSSAKIRIYYSTSPDGSNPVDIVSARSEDKDGPLDIISGNIGMQPLGVYYIFADISDDTTTVTVPAGVTLEVVPEQIIPGNVIVSPETLIKVYEAYTDIITESFTVVLDKAPEADVSIALTNPFPEGLNMSADNLVFDATNWNIPQTVEISAINNCIKDPTRLGDIVIQAAQSTDPAFDNVKGNDVQIQIINEDAIIENTSGTAVSDRFVMCGFVLDSVQQNADGNFETRYQTLVKNISGITQYSIHINLVEESVPSYVTVLNGRLEYGTIFADEEKLSSTTVDVLTPFDISTKPPNASRYILRVGQIIE